MAVKSQESAQGSKQLNQKLTDLQQSLASNNLALEEAQALTHLGSWQWDVASNNISWSDELYRIYGLKPQEREIGFEEFIGLIHPEDRERVQGVIGSAFQTGSAFEFEHRIILPNKKIRILYGKGKSDKNQDGSIKRMVGTSQDVTEQRIADQALHLSDERFKAVTAATSDIVYDRDLTKNLMWFNESLFSGYGYTKRTFEPSYDWWLKQLHPDDAEQVQASLSKAINSRQTNWEAEYRFKRHDGSYVDVRDRAYIIRGHKQLPIRVVGSLLDITKQKELERAKDEFISLASHQLRTPATAVKQYLSMLLSGYGGDVPEKHEPFLNTAYNANERQLNIINDLLRTAQLESGQYVLQKENHDIHQLIQDVVADYQPVIRMREQTVNTDSVLARLVPMDRPELLVAISNLVENASKYSPSGATIIVATKYTTKHVMISVQDQGVGIDKANLDMVFEKFTRLDNELSDTVDGSGLGLYFVNKIIKLHGGKITVRSTPQKGSVFTITLPL